MHKEVSLKVELEVKMVENSKVVKKIVQVNFIKICCKFIYEFNGELMLIFR